jgi:hypothetical protein
LVRPHIRSTLLLQTTSGPEERGIPSEEPLRDLCGVESRLCSCRCARRVNVEHGCEPLLIGSSGPLGYRTQQRMLAGGICAVLRVALGLLTLVTISFPYCLSKPSALRVSCRIIVCSSKVTDRCAALLQRVVLRCNGELFLHCRVLSQLAMAAGCRRT